MWEGVLLPAIKFIGWTFLGLSALGVLLMFFFFGVIAFEVARERWRRRRSSSHLSPRSWPSEDSTGSNPSDPKSRHLS